MVGCCDILSLDFYDAEYTHICIDVIFFMFIEEKKNTLN